MRDRLLVTGLLALVLLVALAGVSAAQGPGQKGARVLQADVGTVFTYQGSLIHGDSPVDTPHELRFILYDSEAGGSQVGATLTLPDVPVDNGVFTAPVDFGPGIFDGRAFWLEVAVRPSGSTGAFATLSPRQPLTAAPYASYAAGSWNLKGNAGTESDDNFIGTTDAEPLVVRTNNAEALRVVADGSVGIGTGAPQARLESVAPTGAALMGTGSQRGVVGRIGAVPCGGTFAVGGCAGASNFPAVFGQSQDGYGVLGNSSTAVGVGGNSTSGRAVQGMSGTGIGVYGVSTSSAGVYGASSSSTEPAVEGASTAGIGVHGRSPTRGVVGTLGFVSCPGAPYGVGGCAGDTGAVGVSGHSDTGIGVRGTGGTGVRGAGTIGVAGDSAVRGVAGTLGGTPCEGSYAVGGCSGNAAAVGVYGYSINTAAMWARTETGDLFVGVTGAAETRRARIDVNGRGFFNNGTQTGGADYAESMRTTDDPADLEPGDVLALDPQSGYAVRLSREANSRLVAGVYSTRPSILAVGDHGVDDPLAGEVPVALLGVVPTKVTAANGPIQIGDLLVASALPGRAMKARPDVVNGVLVYPTGAILGKALEPLLSGTGMIRVLVTLR